MNEKEMVISDLLYRSEVMDMGKSDSVVAPAQLRWFGKYVSFQFGPESVWADVAGSVPLPLNLHAFRQVCAKLGAAVWTGKGRASQQAAQRSLPVDFLLALPDEITEKNMNWATETYASSFPKRKWLVREYESEPQEGVSTRNIRAVVDGLYPAISNTELLYKASEMIAGGEHKLVRPHLTPDEMNVRIALRDVGENYAVGVYIGNSEIGTSKIRILPFIQRHSCTNSIVSVDGGMELVHRGDIHALRVQAMAAMAQSLHATGEMLEKMVEAEKELVPNFQAVLRGLSLQYNWTEEMSSAVTLGTEGQATRAGVVNGVTYAAHKILTGTAQADMEILGGAILVAPNSLFARAARISERTNERDMSALRRRRSNGSDPVTVYVKIEDGLEN